MTKLADKIARLKREHDGGRPHLNEDNEATPIWISARTRQLLVAAAFATLLLLFWRASTVVTVFIGGSALALLLSFPTRALSRVLPRSGAIATSILLSITLVVVALTVAVPIAVNQLRSLVVATPGIARQLQERVPPVLDSLAGRGLVPQSPESALGDIPQRLLAAVQEFVARLLGGLGSFFAGVAGVIAALVGMLFVAVYLLADSRRIQATVLRAAPHGYRRDVRALWNAFSQTLSRYIGGLALTTTLEGVLAGIAFHFIGLPYAFLLGGWVSVTAFIPYVGAWIGYAPSLLLALSISSTRAGVALVASLVINAFVGNVISPRVQGQAVRVHPLLIFLAATAGGELFGVPGVVLAVPTVAMLRVLFDFFRARLRVRDDGAASLEFTS